MRRNWILLALTFAVAVTAALRMAARTGPAGEGPPRAAGSQHTVPPSWRGEEAPLEGQAYSYTQPQPATPGARRPERPRPTPSPPRKVGRAMAATVSATRDQVAEAMERRKREETR